MICMEWKDIIGYEGRYQISLDGRVKSLSRSVRSARGSERVIPEIIMKPQPHFKGYHVIFLRRGEVKHRKFFVHRLVGEHFIPNPENKPIVNHKDLDKTNNHIENLEWASERENTQHYYDNKEPF